MAFSLLNLNDNKKLQLTTGFSIWFLVADPSNEKNHNEMLQDHVFFCLSENYKIEITKLLGTKRVVN